jgi:hypothetical protein
MNALDRARLNPIERRTAARHDWESHYEVDCDACMEAQRRGDLADADCIDGLLLAREWVAADLAVDIWREGPDDDDE